MLTAMTDAELVLTDPWIDLRKPDEQLTEHATRLLAELRRELASGHALAVVPFELIGCSEARDDILLRLPDSWAIVHLSWSGTKETPPWPTTRNFATTGEVEVAMDMDA